MRLCVAIKIYNVSEETPYKTTIFLDHLFQINVSKFSQKLKLDWAGDQTFRSATLRKKLALVFDSIKILSKVALK